MNQDATTTPAVNAPRTRSDEEQARANLGTGNRKNPIKMCASLVDQQLVFAEGSFEPNCVLYIRNCENCSFVVNVHSTKVMIEGCKNCRVALNGKVITNTAEVWKCNNVEVKAAVKLSLQVDLCDNLKLRYPRVADLVQVVWAGMNDFELSFDDGDVATHPTLVTGLAQMRAKHTDGVNAELDQFIVRTIDGALLEERIVRLPNGFPTTDREADAFDREAAKKDEAMRQMAINMIKENPGVFAGAKKATEPKVKEKKPKPNEPCHCGSSKKYKKCCLEADEQAKKKGPERAANVAQLEKKEDKKQ